MLFGWGAAKSERNRRARELPFELAVMVFEGPAIERIDRRRDHGETRIAGIGQVGEPVLAGIWTDRGETRRLISPRRADRREAHACEAAIQH